MSPTTEAIFVAACDALAAVCKLAEKVHDDIPPESRTAFWQRRLDQDMAPLRALAAKLATKLTPSATPN